MLKFTLSVIFIWKLKVLTFSKFLFVKEICTSVSARFFWNFCIFFFFNQFEAQSQLTVGIVFWVKYIWVIVWFLYFWKLFFRIMFSFLFFCFWTFAQLRYFLYRKFNESWLETGGEPRRNWAYVTFSVKRAFFSRLRYRFLRKLTWYVMSFAY